jgi:hypothetical protein
MTFERVVPSFDQHLGQVAAIDNHCGTPRLNDRPRSSTSLSRASPSTSTVNAAAALR